ncbi:hypothetical protein BDW62DRAFT_177540 [Aspergillus aurantiobrunneus]
MPKKHHRNTFAKPVSPAHHTLDTSSSRSSHNDRFRSSAASTSGDQPSVNDLINHLRRTQLPDSNRGTPRHIAPRSVHPSLRNLFDLPETPPPRPRPDTRRTGIGGQRLRRTAGPPPPESWLSGDTTADEAEGAELEAAETAEVIYRLERLPGMKFPARSSFLHALLKSMTTHWAWHVAYDGQFLGLLPTHIKILLLSYVGYYARGQPPRSAMHGLKPLFDKLSTLSEGHDQLIESESGVTHLDLSGALGRWISLKQLSTELFLPKKAGYAQDGATNSVPLSWEDEYEDWIDPGSSGTIPKSLQHLRFENLQYLSLAHPHPASVNWNSLISLLSRLSTITHLSLAHWPVPTITPNALNASVRHPTQRSLTFSYGGTDSYSAMENNWAESAGILRRLSRVTYCLKWLDLEGCGDWIPALNWEGAGPNGETCSTGPEWNGSWRDIEWIRFGSGWLPRLEDSDLDSQNTTSYTPEMDAANHRSLASSAHAPAPSNVSTMSNETWDVDEERRRYRLVKELERFREMMRAAKDIQRRVLQTRKEGRGKWIHFSFGLEELTDQVREKLLGSELRDTYV